MQNLNRIFQSISASQAADYFLSPHVKKEALLDTFGEDESVVWIVNRSDVYDETLEIIRLHKNPEISSRASFKLLQRKSTLRTLTPPEEFLGDLNEVPDFMIEELLGHPLAPFEIMMHFSLHELEDYRASAALSLTRRLLEYPPNFNLDPGQSLKLKNHFFERLMTDPSPFVRSYIARAPLFEAGQVAEALDKEIHPFVCGRLAQNSSFDFDEELIFKKSSELGAVFFTSVILLDNRCSETMISFFDAKNKNYEPDNFDAKLISYFRDKLPEKNFQDFNSSPTI